MRWRRNLKLSVRALSRSWQRTALSAGAVGIGIGSVVVLIGAGTGAERALLKALEPLGHNLLVVSPSRTRTGALRGESRVAGTIGVEEWRAIAREAPGVLRTAPIAEASAVVRAGGRTVEARVIGTTADFERARNSPVIAGRFIDEDDLRERSRVAVVGAQVVEELFQGESPLGERLLVRGAPYCIVGLMRKKGVSVDGADEDELVIIPLTTAMRRLLNVDSLDRIYVQAVSEASIPAARSGIAGLLRRMHDTAAGEADRFSIVDQTATVRAQRQTRGSLARVATVLSALALGLAGVGLLAVSLLSVRERYPEIGLRLAVGGRPHDVLLQFITEAVLVSAAGGAAGLVTGAAAILLGASLTRWPMALSWQAVVYPSMISLGIAVIFGAYPALRAARVDPIHALNSRQAA